MLIIIVTAAIALGWVYLRPRLADPARLAEPHLSLPAFNGIQIICGDCAGEAEFPKKTYMDRFGHCAQCGGSNFMLAADRGLYAQKLRAARLSGYERAAKESRVLPFEARFPARAVQAEKIAV
jgi:hypothetical protein